MDTDDLTPLAYDVIFKANNILEVLKTDIGFRSSKHDNEGSFLEGTLDFVNKIIKEPETYLDFWNHTDDIEIEYFIEQLLDLKKCILEVIETPIESRGTPPFE